MQFRPLFLLSPLLFMLPVAAAEQETNSTYLIEPGKGIGKIKLGMTRKAVIEVLGIPDVSATRRCGIQVGDPYDKKRVCKVFGGFLIDEWRSKTDSKSPLWELLYLDGKVIQITAWTLDTKTRDGLTLSSPIADFQKRLKGVADSQGYTYGYDTDNMLSNDYAYHLDFKTVGLTLKSERSFKDELDHNGSSEFIAVHRPNEWFISSEINAPWPLFEKLKKK